MAGWLVLLHPCNYLGKWIVSDFSPGDPDNDWITGGKEMVTVGPESSGLPRDPDCCGTTVLVTNS